MNRATALACALLLLGAASCRRRPPLDEDHAVKVVSVLPQVKTQRGGDLSWTPTRTRDLLAPMDKIQTFADASATLELREDQRLTVQELSLVVIGDYVRDIPRRQTTGVIEVQQGRLATGSPAKGENAVAMTYKTPNSEVSAERKAAAEGYELVIVSGGQDDKLSVHEGKAKVSAQGVSVEVPAHQGTRVEKGKAPQPPKPLPPAPVPLTREGERFSLVEGRTGLTLRWAPARGARSYRVSAASDEGFMKLAAERATSSETVTAGGMAEGGYYWRVSATDADGLESEPSAPRRFSVGRLFADVPLPGGEKPALAARFVPEDAGRKYYVGGYLRHPDLDGLDVVAYAMVDGWYAQWYPYTPQGLMNVVVEPDGYFEIATNGGTRFKVFAVRKGYAGMPPFRRVDDPPKADGKDVLLETEARPLARPK